MTGSLIAFRPAFRLSSLIATAVVFQVPAMPARLAARQLAPDTLKSADVSAMKFRNLGGAFMSGRIVEVAVDPTDKATWYVAAASGGVWKTTNAGVTFDPIFDHYGSYSIGTVAIDPGNPSTVWVGTGENNSQRSVAYGDGIYKSTDGGRSFEKMGLGASEHIARIRIDPDNSDRVFVAAQGPLWNAGGERGVYRTEDGGRTWEQVLSIDENTGVNDLLMDPRDPDVLYASAYQRRRHVWTLIDGGPGSGIWKSTDGGDSWRKIESGIPGGDKGRIGLALAPSNPDILYAIIELPNFQSGFYRSTNGGESWERRSGQGSTSPQYYNEIYVDLDDPDFVYSLDTSTMISEDGGRTFSPLGETDKHVDNHALWIDPDDGNHLIEGCDGGLYETWDRGAHWRFFTNLPLAQYYKVAVSYGEPFFYVYGGTQDNATHGVPSGTMNTHGIRNSDWFTTVFGDGFGPAVDPSNPDIVYSEWQYGGLVRYDRRSGEAVDVKPQESADGPPLVWNWDSPILISPHDPSRLYFGAQMLFRSDDRGDSWTAISPDLTRGLDRNRLDVMGRIWSVDAVAKNASTSLYGNITTVSESPVTANLLYVGTDDGLIQVSEDGGVNWRRIEQIPGVPDRTYVNDIEASRTDPNTVYAAFNNHKMGDFKPYLLVSRDRGRSWHSIAGNLPERGSVYTIVQDDEVPGLLFAGTEFGLWVTRDEGNSWTKMGGGLPTIAIRDLVIQRDDDALVAASFGRGFWIFDDYSPLRTAGKALAQDAEAHIFPIRPAMLYTRVTPLGVGGRAFQGSDFHTDQNPQFGAVFTYSLKTGLETKKIARQSEERRLAGNGEDTPYPSWEALQAEDREEEPAIVLTVRDRDGGVVRRVTGPASAGLHTVSWNLRYPGFTPVTAGTGSDGNGPAVVPGGFTVELARHVNGEFETLTGRVPFQVEAIGLHTMPVPDRGQTLAFYRRAGDLQRRVMGTNAAAAAAMQSIQAMKNAAMRDPAGTTELRQQARALELRMMDLQQILTGDQTRSRRQEAAMPGVIGRIQTSMGDIGLTRGPSLTHRQQLDIAEREFNAALAGFRQLIEQDVPALGSRFDAAGIRWTTGRGVPGG